MRKVTWRHVDSSVIDALYWNPDTKTLYVLFLSGSYYAYYDVNRYRYYRFRNAESIGRYFNSYIKNNYRYRRMN